MITSNNPQTQPIKPPAPFIQWVGGKRKISQHLIKHLPQISQTKQSNYYEPFLGGGALFFQVKHLFKQSYLSDINLELVTSYNAVKKQPVEVIKLLESHQEKHCKDYYYQMRDVNNFVTPTELSARFLYLNRYAFRGIYRINSKNKLECSFTEERPVKQNAKQNAKAKIASKLKDCSLYLQEASIYASDFSFIEPKPNDFVYFDPPYHQAGERFYTRLPFDETEQIRLRDFAKDLSASGVKLMISSSDTSFIRSIYSSFNISTINVTYSLPKDRKSQQELIIKNY